MAGSRLLFAFRLFGFLRQAETLPEETRLLLLVAAAEPVGDPRLVWRAAERLALGSQLLTPRQKGC
jgi:hypothetical protein